MNASASLTNRNINLGIKPVAQNRAVHGLKINAPTYRVSQPRQLTVVNVFGGGGEKKKLTREDEPDEYWTSEAERKGVSPFKDPLALIGIGAIFFPFVILGIAIATGLVDLNAGR